MQKDFLSRGQCEYTHRGREVWAFSETGKLWLKCHRSLQESHTVGKVSWRHILEDLKCQDKVWKWKSDVTGIIIAIC